jgi:hypothetical protein
MATSVGPMTHSLMVKTRSKDKQLLLHTFLSGEIDGRDFHHADHVRVGFELLCRHTFPDALAAYSAALKGIATRAGNPDAYHETITVAFLSLIAEQHVGGRYGDFEAFIGENPELLDKSILGRWYAPERLLSDVARKTFVMPHGDRLRPKPGGKGRTRSAGGSQ